MEDYVRALCQEIENRKDELSHTRVRTIYIGGGTPSLLSHTSLNTILDVVYNHYDVDRDAEVTMEMNPDDCPLGRGAVNRVSLGIQSFDDSLLRLIRRRHDSATAICAVRHLQDAGIRNISIDLISGLPGQTLELWEHDLDTAFSLGVQHLSAYALSYEAGTLLTRWREEGRVREVSEELFVAMYERLCQRARAAGFEHYEISNFALPGFHSRHNSSYWTGEPYLGFGPGAHSYDGKRTRKANRPRLDEYIQSWAYGSVCRDSIATKESLSLADLYDEAVMCGLRTARGIDLHSIAERFGQSQCDDLLRMAAPHLSAGRLVKNDGFLCLTEKSLMTSDDIMSDLMAID